MDVFDSINQHMHAVLTEGTEDLREEAIRAVGKIVGSTTEAVIFCIDYAQLDQFLEENGGATPDGVYPPLAEATLAVNSLKAAMVNNILAHPGLKAAFGGDRAARKSYRVLGTEADIAHAVLKRKAAKQ